MSVKIDWSREIRKFLTDNFEPIDSPINETEFTEKMSLNQIYALITKVLPKDFIYETDVYEALEDLDYKNYQYTIEAKHDPNGKLLKPEQISWAYFLERKTINV